MPETALLPDSAAPAAGPEALDDTHYRQSFGALCEDQVVSATNAIYAENGTKLIEKGSRIDRELYARLVQHKLRDPIDQQIGIEGMVNHESLEAMAAALLDQATVPRLLAASLGRPAALLQPLRELPLPGPIALKLTLMRDRCPALLQHALATLLVAMFLADRANMPTPLRSHLAAAALLRDIGMLHMDPAWLAADRRLNAQERRHLHAHPITSVLLIRQQGGYAPEVAAAVFEHHERLDGSGYPRGLRAERISPMGRILLLAELVAALGHKFGEASPHRLGLVLRLNHRALPGALIAQLLPALQGDVLASKVQVEEASQRFAGVANAFEQWTELQQDMKPGEVRGEAFAWLNSRLAGLRQSLTEAGGPPEQPSFLLAHAAGDDLHVADALALGREALWQLGSICGHALQRWPALADAERDHAAGDAAVARWCAWTGAMLAGLPGSSVD
ncbi:HD-GYP domain-containing protein [Xylophilus sp. GOD-11R]|uniref:HD-GYP domain-containing protein n=1 Tax=Xylophilus sp. GOD-11R TaxID=3089814 RepID=UPI00298CC0DF|nr:HD domain-containing phosphohydrolase [Xylophilus sp. GOD-11R]WPB56492.1 HD domain-containing phosphohydrolase [Xylophilus sp. GOD-11R]